MIVVVEIKTTQNESDNSTQKNFMILL